MKIIIGLGNPGDKYQFTRHNAGWLALDYLIQKIASDKGETASWEENKKLSALIYKSGDYLFAKPLTFMNESGRAVQAILSYYHLLPKKLGLFKSKDSDLSQILFVIHDEIDLDLGQIRLSADSRSAGHRGVESIIRHLKTKNFSRWRLGINTPNKGQTPTEKFVLQRFTNEELEKLEKTFAGLKF